MAERPRVELAAWQAIVSEDDGTLPDGEVVGVDQVIWDRLLSTLHDRGWSIPCESDGHQLVAKASPSDGVLINIWRFGWDTFDFDFDRRELQTQAALDGFCEFVRTVGRTSQRDVTLFAEGAQPNPHLRFATYRFAEDVFELREQPSTSLPPR